MRKKHVQILGTTLAATAIVGGSAAAASAHDLGHYGDAHSAFGTHSTVGGHSFAPQRTTEWNGPTVRGFDPAGRYDAVRLHRLPDFRTPDGRTPDSDAPDAARLTGTPAAKVPHFGHHLDGHRFTRPLHHVATFAQRQAAIVDGLTAAENRLAALQNVLSTAAANDPTGGAAKALAYVTAARTRIESVLSQVQAATTEQQLESILGQLNQTPPVVPVPGA